MLLGPMSESRLEGEVGRDSPRLLHPIRGNCYLRKPSVARAILGVHCDMIMAISSPIVPLRLEFRTEAAHICLSTLARSPPSAWASVTMK